jgi:hypothetical protein
VGENPLFYSVTGGDIGLYEKFKKNTKAKEKKTKCTIKVMCRTYCLVALSYIWDWEVLGT